MQASPDLIRVIDGLPKADVKSIKPGDLFARYYRSSSVVLTAVCVSNVSWKPEPLDPEAPTLVSRIVTFYDFSASRVIRQMISRNNGFVEYYVLFSCLE